MFKFVLVLFLIISIKEFHRNEMQFEKRLFTITFPDVYYLKFYGQKVFQVRSQVQCEKNTDMLIIFSCFLFFISLQKKHITITGIQRLKEKRDNNKGYINDSEIFFA